MRQIIVFKVNRWYNIDMQLGISTASYFTRRYTEEALIEIAAAGAHVCEIFLASHCEYGDDFAAVLKRELDDVNVTSRLDVHSVHALTNQFEPELFGVGRARSDAEITFGRVLKTAGALGAKNYTFHGPTRLKSAVKYVFDYPALAARVNELCEIASGYGVRFCYENVHWTYCSTPEYYREISSRAPALGACLDIKQAMQSKISYTRFLDAMKGRLATVHLCDYDENGDLTMPGRGIFDFKELFARLKDVAPDASCLIEVYSRNYKEVSEIKESFDYLSSLM